MAIVPARNTIFVRFLSPQVSESTLRGIFGPCDVITKILFRAFPGRNTEYYAQIDFNSSAGVVEGHKMTGTAILGVTCQVSVVDPGSKDLLRKVYETDKNAAGVDENAEIRAPSASEPQGVQLEYIRKYRELAEAKRLKTVHVAGLEPGVTEEEVRTLCSRLGTIADMRLDEGEEGKPFALVEFTEAAPAFAAKSRQGFVVDGKVIVFTESKTLINTEGFAEQSVHFQSALFVPELVCASQQAAMCVQAHLTPKLVKARLAAAEITKQPIPEEVKAAEAAYAHRAKEQLSEPTQVEWAGRSEKDFLRDLAALSRRPSSDERWAARRKRSHSRKRSGSRDRSRRRRRGRRRDREASRSPGGSRKRHRGGDATAEKADIAVDVEDLDLAVVPNTELLVLGESSSYSSSASPARENEELARELQASPGVPKEAATLETAAVAEIADDLRPAEAVAGEAANSGAAVDVDEKEQWIAPVDVDEEGSCDEVPTGDEGDVVPIVGKRARRALLEAVSAAQAASAAVAEGGAAAPAQAPEVASVEGGGQRPAGASPPAAHAAEAAAGAPPRPARSTTPAAAVPPGDTPSASSSSIWECSACGEVNKARREQCNNCNADAPWITVKSPAGDDDEVDELSSASSQHALSVSPARSSSSHASTKASAPKGKARRRRRVARSVAAVTESSPHDVAESPARSVVDSDDSARSVAESQAQSVADLDEVDSDMVDIDELEKEEQRECEWEAERVHGEIADARARIYHST